ncbi:hypothetical protein L2735_14105 [Shewanella olleyana]|uniref:hypothetical protein n=1 Tax=Shewanella olleyana TaxID=135626 RepID=UPI0020107A1D|nr:hypothetical protein [Shewanella olleyana]MCL1067924.1 hypothetical protein [Shewanella olleyana]
MANPFEQFVNGGNQQPATTKPQDSNPFAQFVTQEEPNTTEPINGFMDGARQTANFVGSVADNVSLLGFARRNFNENLPEWLQRSEEGQEYDQGIRDSLQQGLTLGFSDEIKGAANAGAKALMEFEATNFKENYEQARDAERLSMREFAEKYPNSAVGAELLGGLAAPAAGANWVGQGANALNRAGRTAMVGGVYGATEGAGSSEGKTASEVASDAAVGGGIGAVLSPVVGGVAEGATSLASRVPWFRRMLEGSPEADAQNTLTRYLNEEVKAGRLNADQVAADLAELSRGGRGVDATGNPQAGTGSSVMLADADAMQSLTASINRNAGTPRVGTSVTGDKNPTGTLLERQAARQNQQQADITEAVSPTVQAGDDLGVSPNTATRTLSTGEVLDSGSVNFERLNQNQRAELNQETASMYQAAYQTPASAVQLPKELQQSKAMKTAFSEGSRIAKELDPQASRFQILDETAKALYRNGSRASGSERTAIMNRWGELNDILTNASPDYQDAKAIQSWYNEGVLKQAGKGRDFFGSNEEQAANTFQAIKDGNWDLASAGIGQAAKEQIQKIANSPRDAREGATRLLTDQQLKNVEKVSDLSPRMQTGNLKEMLNLEQRQERTRRLAELTTGKTMDESLKSSLTTVLGGDDLLVGTVLSSAMHPTAAALPWMINRGIASSKASEIQQETYREIQRILYRDMTGSPQEVKDSVAKIFSLDFEKVPADHIREFGHLMGQMAGITLAGEAEPIQ